ncbi:hypothetical protein LTR81_028061 [Elasticomyces elasticus]
MSSAPWQETPALTPTPAHVLRVPSKRKSTPKAKPDSAPSARASKKPKTNGRADVTSEGSQHSSVQPDDPSSTAKPVDTTLMELARSAVVHCLAEETKELGKTAWLTEGDIIKHIVKERAQPEYLKCFKNLTDADVEDYLGRVFKTEEDRPSSDRKLYRGAPQVDGGPLDKNATYWSVSSKARLSQDAMTSGEAANSPLQRSESPVSNRRLDQHHGAEETELSPQGLVPIDHTTMQPTLLDKLHLVVKKKHADLDKEQKVSFKLLEESWKQKEQEMLALRDKEVARLARYEEELTEAVSRYHDESSSFGAHQIGSLRHFSQD